MAKVVGFQKVIKIMLEKNCQIMRDNWQLTKDEKSDDDDAKDTSKENQLNKDLEDVLLGMEEVFKYLFYAKMTILLTVIKVKCKGQNNTIFIRKKHSQKSKPLILSWLRLYQ